MEKVLLILTNMPDVQSAHALAHQLVESRLAACVNVFPSIKSVYQWQGTTAEAEEVAVHIKSVQARYKEIESAIKTAHPYQVPEIIAIQIADGSPEYLGWIEKETSKDINV